ncbi:MAG: NADH dehydrogenase subunit D, partial [Mycobacterium sp.]
MSTPTTPPPSTGGTPKTVLTVGGQEWEQVVEAAKAADPGERIVVNMGP